MKSKWNSRKVIFGLLILTVGILIELLSPRGLTDVFATILGSVGLIYFIGNIGEHVANGKYKQREAAPTIDTSALSKQLEELDQKLMQIGVHSVDEGAKYAKAIKGINTDLANLHKKSDFLIIKAEYIISKAVDVAS